MAKKEKLNRTLGGGQCIIVHNSFSDTKVKTKIDNNNENQTQMM